MQKKELLLAPLLTLLVILTLFGFALAEDGAGLTVSSQQAIFSRIQDELGTGETPAPDELGELKVNFQTFNPTDDYFVCTKNEDDTCCALLVIEGQTLRYSSLSLEDTRVMSAIVFLNVGKISGRIVRFCCETGIWQDGNATILSSSGNSNKNVLALGKTIYQGLVASGRIVEAQPGTAIPIPTLKPEQTHKPIASTTPKPLATPVPKYESMQELPFYPSYQDAKTRLTHLSEYLRTDSQYHDYLKNIPEGALIKAVDVQLWNIPIESGTFEDNHFDSVYVLKPSLFTNQQDTQQEWYINAFRIMYKNLKMLYGDYTAYQILCEQKSYSLDLDPDYGRIKWLMMNKSFTMTFYFGNDQLTLSNVNSPSVCLCSRNLAVPIQIDHSSDLLFSSIPSEAFQKQECSKVIFPQYDQRLESCVKEIMTSPRKIKVPKTFPLGKLGNVSELERYFAFKNDLNDEIYAMEELNLCKTGLFGYRIEDIQIENKTRLSESDTILIYPYIDFDGYLDGQLQMFDALYQAMTSKLGAPTSYVFNKDGIEYRIPDPINISELKYQYLHTRKQFNLVIDFRNFKLVWNQNSDCTYSCFSSAGGNDAIYVQYNPNLQLNYKTYQLNECLLAYTTGESDYQYQKPTFSKDKINEARLEDPIAVYVYGKYTIADNLNTGIDLYKSLTAKESANPLDIGDSGNYYTVYGDQALITQLVNSSMFNDVDTYTLVGYCLDGYGNPIIGCSNYVGHTVGKGRMIGGRRSSVEANYWFSFTFSNTIKANSKGRSGKMVFEGIQDPKFIYLAVKSAHTSDGQTFNIDDLDLHFFYWTK